MPFCVPNSIVVNRKQLNARHFGWHVHSRNPYPFLRNLVRSDIYRSMPQNTVSALHVLCSKLVAPAAKEVEPEPRTIFRWLLVNFPTVLFSFNCVGDPCVEATSSIDPGNPGNFQDLHYQLSRGQVRILSDQPDYVAGSPYNRPPQTSGSNLENFDKTEVSHMTLNTSGGRVPPSITSMIARRQCGQLRGGRGFSTKERCGINNQKLPVNMKIVDSYESKAFCGVYNQKGDKLLTASQDRFMRLYDSSTGSNFRLLSEIQGRDVGWSILDAEFSPDSNYVAYSSWSTNLHLVDLDSDLSSHTALPLVPLERKFCIFSLKFSSGGDEILCGANDGHIYIYNLRANRRTLKVDAHDEDVNTVAFADETSKIVFSGSDDGLVKVWDRRSLNEHSPKPVGVLAGHLDGVVYIDSREDSRHLISNSKDQSIKLWDMRKFSSEEAQEKTKRTVSHSRWDYRWQTAPRKLRNRKHNMKGDTSLATYRGHSVLQTQIRCHFSPAFTTGQRYIYTGCAFGAVVIYDVLTGEQVVKNKGHSSVVRDVSWHPFRNEIVSVSWDFSVMYWSQFLASPPPDEDREVGEEVMADTPAEENGSWEGTVWNGGKKLVIKYSDFMIVLSGSCSLLTSCNSSLFPITVDRVVGGPAGWPLRFRPGSMIDERVPQTCAPPSAATTHHHRTSP